MSKPMKKFAGTKKLDVIKARCAAAGVAVDDWGFRTLGRDYICLGVANAKRPDGSPFVYASRTAEWPHACVMFNTFNGTFFGETDKGVAFNSSSTKYEEKAWFQKLLTFFYYIGDEPGVVA